MAARLVTSSPLVVLATAQPSSSSSSPRRSANARKKNAMRPSAAASKSSAAVSAAAAAPTTTAKPHSASTPRPDAAGRFGAFGGKYVPETLIAALTELEQEYAKAQADPAFKVWKVMVNQEIKKTRRCTRGTLNEEKKKKTSPPTPPPKPFSSSSTPNPPLSTPGPVRVHPQGLRRPPLPSLPRRAPLRALRRQGADLAQARGPQPHGRAQDQQLSGPGAAVPAHVEEADHRRDGRRAARRGDGDGVRQVWPAVHHLHG